MKLKTLLFTIACLLLLAPHTFGQSTHDLLIWKSGEKLPGKIVSADEKRLNWQADNLFRDALALDASFLDQVQFNIEDANYKTEESFMIQTIDGNSMFGNVLELDDEYLRAISARMGEVKIPVAQLASIINLEKSESQLVGEFNLEQWNADRSEKKYWTVNSFGQLVCTHPNTKLYTKSDLPESCLIEVEFQWETKLDCVFGFGVPRNRTNLDTLPRLETWDDSVVLSYKDSFEIVVESLDQASKRLKLLVHWDRKTNQMVIHDERGQQLASANIGAEGRNIDPGILIENKAEQLIIDSLSVRRSSVGFDATKPSIQSTGEAAINGRLDGFDGKKWTVSVEGADEPLSVAASDFCGAYLINESTDRLQDVTMLSYQDGMLVMGQLTSITDNTAVLKTSFSESPVSLNLANALRMNMATPDAEVQAEFSQQLINEEGTITGRLESGSGDSDDVLRWRVPGADEAVPFAHGNSKIILREKVTDDGQLVSTWQDTLILDNRDIIPANVVSMNESEVTIDSFIEKKKIASSLIKAIDFGNLLASEAVAVDPTTWFVSNEKKTKRCFDGGQVRLVKDVEVGYSELLVSGSFSFDIEWTQQYGTLHCRMFVDKFLAPENDYSINFLIYDGRVSVAKQPDFSNGSSGLAIKNKKVKVQVTVHQGELQVKLGGKVAYREKIDIAGAIGRGVGFASNDMYGSGGECKISNFKIERSAMRRHAFVDEKRRELLLTIPRLKKLSPPQHIVCAINSDLLRGDVISLTKDSLVVRSFEEQKHYPRSLISSIVWLHPDALLNEITNNEPNTNEFEEKDETKAQQKVEVIAPSENKRQVVQVIMQGNRQMTLELTSSKDGVLTGDSAVLGKCEIPFDEICELRMGKFASEARDVPYSDWEAHIAPAPVLETADGSESSQMFGGDSPLVGKAAPNADVKLLDGTEFTLNAHKGKIVILDFWATWCGPCIAELPKIAGVVNGYTEDQVILVAMNQEESKETIEEFLTKRNWTMTVGLDSGTIGAKYGASSIPLTVVINQKGEVAFVKSGGSSDTEAKLKAAIDQLLNPPTETTPAATEN